MADPVFDRDRSGDRQVASWVFTANSSIAEFAKRVADSPATGGWPFLGVTEGSVFSGGALRFQARIEINDVVRIVNLGDSSISDVLDSRSATRLGPCDVRPIFTGATPTVATINNAAAVDKGDGTVGIPATAHGLLAGGETTLAGTTNYDGTFVLTAATSVNELVIPATFVAETFAGTETATASLVAISF